MRRSVSNARRGNFGRLIQLSILLVSPMLYIGCETQEAAVGANESTTERSEQVSFSDWDVNRDDYLMETEFTAFFSQGQWFSNADKNKDNYVDQQEFSDAADKLKLTDGEQLASRADKNSMRKWDKDKSGDLSEEESNAAAYDTWDTNDDKRVDLDEFATGWFGSLDANRDQRLAAQEFNKGIESSL